MDSQQVFTLGQQSLYMLLMISAPILLTVLAVGLVVSIFQAATQIHEATLSFVPKIVAAVAVLAIAGPWMLTSLVEFLQRTLQVDPDRRRLGRRMLTFTEADVLAWVTPILWPFLRVLALFSALPVIAQRSVPMRLRIGLAFLVAFCAQASIPAMAPIALDSAAGMTAVLQQVLVGVSLGFSVRIVFAAVEFAGEVVGLQMGLNFASFFNPMSGGEQTAVSRFFGVSISWLFIVSGGHLLVIAAVVQSFTAFPVSGDPFAFLRDGRAAALGRRDLQPGPVDRAAAGRDAALHQPRPRRDLAGRTADEHLRDRLSDHARRRPGRRAADAAADGDAVHDGARADARAVPVTRTR